MYKIKNKQDSIDTMKQLGLNYFPLEIFDVKDEDSIRSFFQKYPAEEYVMRNPVKAQGKFYFVKNLEEALEKLKNFKTKVTINVSATPFKDDIVLLGDIKVNRGYNESVDLTARTDPDATHRNIYENPQYNLHRSLDDDAVWKIPGFSKIMAYISEHELYGIIVEFAVYSCRLGVKKENVVIYELRTEY